VIADHLRSTSFLLADGVLPSNEGRGYVLRRIMRRAMRHAHLLGAKDPLMHRLVPALVQEMGAAYPELGRAQPLIEETCSAKKIQFRRTLANGLKLLDEATGDMGEGGQLPGETAFKLYDTFGFPYDLTEDALRARGIAVDRAGFDAAMAQQKAAARAAWKGSGQAADEDVWFDIAERAARPSSPATPPPLARRRLSRWSRMARKSIARRLATALAVVVNQTPFYGESGGQSGDAGVIAGADGLALTVSDTAKPLGRLHAHQAAVTAGTIKVGDTVRLDIDVARRDAIRANHSATHLLHAALRNRLGGHVTQKGSLVAADRLRFDYSHPTALSADDITAVEAEVNAQVRGNQPVAPG
jgi:alanyl-tRNA synthetase